MVDDQTTLGDVVRALQELGSRLESRIGETNQRIDQLRTETRVELNGLRGEITSLRGDVVGLRHDISEMNIGMSDGFNRVLLLTGGHHRKLREEVEQLKARVDAIEQRAP